MGLTILSLTGLALLAAYASILKRTLASWNALPEWELPKDFEPRTFITVLIPARNEAANITRLLDTLSRQRYPREKFEVIVIDDHSTDGTPEIVEQYPLSNLRLLRLAEHLSPNGPIHSHKKKALETGVRRARGTLILTTDADCEAPPGWLATYASFHESTGAAFMAAPVLFHREQTLLQRFQALDLIGMMAVTGAGIHSRSFYMANGANLSFTKEIFHQARGYTGNEQHASGDDVFLIQKVAALAPDKVAFLKSRQATVLSLPMPGLKSFVNQRLRWGTKNRSYQDGRITAVLGLVFILCWFTTGMFLAFPVFGWYGLGLALALFAGKGLADYFLLSDAASFFDRRGLMRRFWLKEGLHILYIALVGLLSLVVKEYEWKGRRVK
ncbi:MAG: glycosyltransferase [Lewinellaceae bacterium]|nr:glycosyltransferase [Lewinellaceae bacterium]